MSSTRTEEIVGEGDLVRPVHLGLDDIDRAGAAVAERALTFQVVDRDQRGDGGVEHGLGDLPAFLVEHRIGEHVVADIAHQHEAAPVQAQLAAVRHACRPGPG